MADQGKKQDDPEGRTTGEGQAERPVSDAAGAPGATGAGQLPGSGMGRPEGTTGLPAGAGKPAVTPLPAGSGSPDSVSALVQPGADKDEEELPPRVSTILGPLPAGASIKQTRDLNDAVHRILIYGLSASTVLLLIGLGLEALGGRALPSEVLPIDEAVRRVFALRPSGFLSLGLLVLLATPIVRVVGSVVVFAWERDRRYTLITLTVLIVMAISVFVGHG